MMVFLCELFKGFFSGSTAWSGWAVAIIVFVLGIIFTKNAKITQKVKGQNNVKVNQEISSSSIKDNDGISQEVKAKDNIEVNQKY